LLWWALSFVPTSPGAFSNFFYNTLLIVERLFDAEQKAVFWDLAAPIYNVVAYPFFSRFAVLSFLADDDLPGPAPAR